MNFKATKSQVVIFDFNRTLYDTDLEEIIPGAYDILEYLLQKKVILILLGKGSESRRDLISDLRLDQYFQEIFIVSEKNLQQLEILTNTYPDAEFYSVGDRIKKEITLGNQMGVKTIWIKRGRFASELPLSEVEQPWQIIESLKEIEALVK